MRAFPQLHTIDGNWVKEPVAEYAGMTLRDYFAAAALQGMLSSAIKNDVDTYERAAEISYIIANAMMAEHEKGAK